MTGNIQLNSSMKDGNNTLKIYKALNWKLGFYDYKDYQNYIVALDDIKDEVVLCNFKKAMYEIFLACSKGRIALYDSAYYKLSIEYERYFTKYPPVYHEKGLVNEFKKDLSNSNRTDLIWADIQRIREERYKLLYIPCKSLYYKRTISIMQEKVDIDLVKKADLVSSEQKEEGTTFIVYPYSQIEKEETAKDTILKYYSKDYVVYFGISSDRFSVSINPEYMTYEQFMDTSKSYFETYGLSLTEHIGLQKR